MRLGHTFNSSSKYKFIKRLGSGGSADVFLYSRQTEGLPHQNVVLKVFKTDNPDSMVELLNEGAKLTQLRHPNILTTYGYEKLTSQTFALVLEYVRGKNLAEILPCLGSSSRFVMASYVIRSL